MSNDPHDVPVIDDVVVARLHQLREQVAHPGEDVLGELLALFVKDSRVRLDAIREAFLRGDAEARRQAAHALKGSAGNVGAKRVAALAGVVERGTPEPADLDRLELEVTAAIQALGERLA